MMVKSDPMHSVEGTAGGGYSTISIGRTGALACPSPARPVILPSETEIKKVSFVRLGGRNSPYNSSLSHLYDFPEIYLTNLFGVTIHPANQTKVIL